MAKIVVMPRIEIDNPFGAIAEILKNEAIPLVRQLALNKDLIAILSDKELTDHIPILKRFAPELLTQDGKIDWNKVEEYANSDDLFKQEIGNYLKRARQSREEFANLPIGAKLEKMFIYKKVSDPLALQKEFLVQKVLEKYKEAIDKANLPEEKKLYLLSFAPELAEKFAQNPTRAIAFIKMLENHSKKKQDTTQEQEGEIGSWRLSLDEQGQKRFGIRLEEPQLTPPQISPPQVPKVVGQGGRGVGQKPVVRQTPQQPPQKPPQQPQQNQQTNQKQDNPPFDPNYRPKTPRLLSAPDLVDLLTFGVGAGVGAGATWLASKFGGRIVREAKRIAGKITGKGARKETQQVAENVAKETTQTGAQKVAGEVVEKQTSKYDERRQRVAERIREQLRAKIPATEGRIVDYTPPQFERVPLTKYKELARQKKLPVPAPKETGWKFANAKPPAPVFREGRIVDYTPPQFERTPLTKYARQIRQQKLPTPAPKETGWKFAEQKSIEIVPRKGKTPSDYVPSPDKLQQLKEQLNRLKQEYSKYPDKLKKLEELEKLLDRLIIVKKQLKDEYELLKRVPRR
jgi:hypothetical protein